MRTALVVFVAFVTYAIGAVACRRLSSRSVAAVHPYEVFVVTGLLVATALLHPSHNFVWYHIATMVAMLCIGAVVARATLVTQGRASAGTREFENVAADEGTGSLWKRWVDFSHALVDYEFRLLLVAVYLLVVGPLAAASRLVRARPVPMADGSNWIPRNDVPSMDAARRPF